MTVAINDALTPFLGDGVTKVFTYDFPISATTEMDVLLSGQVLESSEYTVSLDPKIVTFLTAPADGAKGGLFRKTALDQTIVYSRVNSSMNVEALAAQLDKIVLRVQEVGREVDYAVKTDYQDARTRFTGNFTKGDTVKADGDGNFIPGANADQLEGFKDAAAQSATEAEASNVAAGEAQTAAETAQGLSEDARDAAVVAKTASETAQGKAETAQAAAETAQGLSEDAQAASETAQAASEAAKDISVTKAGEAAASEAAAASSASDAATAKTAAETAQSAAETARDQTLASFDSFDDRYLGAKTADPTTDNDGNALVGGALYFNTTDGVMRVYTGTAWVSAYVSGTDFYTKTESDARYATAAQGVKADAAMPKTGGTFSNSVDVYGYDWRTISVHAVSGTASASNSMFRARGSSGSLAAVQANDVLGAFTFWGYDGSAYQQSAYIQALAQTNFASEVSTFMRFSVFNAGAFTIAQTIYKTGGAVFGNPTGGDPGFGKINAVDYWIAGASVADALTARAKLADLASTDAGKGAALVGVEAITGAAGSTVQTVLAQLQANINALPAPVTPDYGAGNAALAAGSIGTYIFARSTQTKALGGTTSGGNLTPTGIKSSGGGWADGGSVSGTWRCMGGGDGSTAGTIWLRIS